MKTTLRLLVLAIAITFFMPVLSFATVIVDSGSSVYSGSHLYYYYGHTNSDTKTITLPGSDNAHSEHGPGSQTGGLLTDAGYTASVIPAEDASFGFTASHDLYYGGVSWTSMTLNFTLDSQYAFDVSGAFNVTGTDYGDGLTNFDVELKRISDSFIYYGHYDTLGTLSAGNGILDAGAYQFTVSTMAQAIGPSPWAGVGYGSIPGGLFGDGQVDLGLNAVPEPTTIALLGIGLAGLAGAGARRKWKNRAVDKS